MTQAAPQDPEKDDLEAVPKVVEALQGFNQQDVERILRWAREKIGLPVAAAQVPRTASETDAPAGGGEAPRAPQPGNQTDIKSFIQQKAPASDQQLAAAVAYFFQFVAPEPNRKLAISGDDLVEACRAAGRARPPRPNQTLVNAFTAGYLDRGEGRGEYKLNSVGENLVAMVLPEGRASAGGGAFKLRRTKPSRTRANSGKAGKRGARGRG